MEYHKISPKAILDQPLVATHVELIQYDLALRTAAAAKMPSNTMQFLQQKLNELASSTIERHRQVVLTRDSVLQYQYHNTPNGPVVFDNERPEQTFELVMEKRWHVIIHELKFSNALRNQNRFCLILVRKKCAGEQPCPKLPIDKKRKLKFKVGFHRSSKKHQNEQQICSNSGVSSSTESDTATNSSASTTDSMMSKILPSCIITEPAILSYPSSQIESLVLLFASRQARRLWQDRLGMYVQRKPLDTHDMSVVNYSKPTPLQLPFASSEANIREFGHTLFQDIYNLNYLKQHPPTGNKSAPLPPLPRLPRNKSTPSFSVKEQTPSRHGIGGAKTKHKLAAKVNYQTTRNFKFGHSEQPTPPPLPPKNIRISETVKRYHYKTSSAESFSPPSSDQPTNQTVVHNLRPLKNFESVSSTKLGPVPQQPPLPLPLTTCRDASPQIRKLVRFRSLESLISSNRTTRSSRPVY